MKKLFLLGLFLCVLVLGIQAQYSYQRIPIANEKIPLNDQLSQGRVSDIIEDERGLMWIGTLDGLNRYDGYKVKTFRHQLNDSTSLDNNQIVKILTTTSGFLWVLTKTGINRFDPYLEKSQLLTFPKHFNEIYKINDIVLDKVENLWIARSDGLYVLKNASETVERIELDAYFYKAQKLEIDQFNNVWVGSNQSFLLKYNHQLKDVYTYDFPIKEDYTKEFQIFDIHQDKEQTIWVSVYNDGVFESDSPNVYYLKKGSQEFQYFTEYISFIKEHQHYSFLSTIRKFESRENELWISGMSNGLACINHKKKSFTYYPEYKEFLWEREIDKNAIYFDSNNELWLGTNGHGAFILPEKGDLFEIVNKDLYKEFALMSVRSFFEFKNKIYIGGYSGLVAMDKKSKDFKKIPSTTVVYCMDYFPGDRSKILIGTEGAGMMKFDPKKNSFQPFLNHIGDTKGYDQTWMWIFDIYNDGDSLYWIGAKNGVIKYHIESESYKLYKDQQSNDFKFGNVLNIYRDFSGRLFAGSDEYGLLEFNEEEDQFQRFKCWRNKDFDFQSFRINHIHQTLDSTLWISTDKGLITFSDNKLKIITQNDGLLNDYVYVSIEDKNGNLWLSTNDGIYRYNIELEQFTSFSIYDGLQAQEFNTAAHYKSSDGMLFFGGVNGFNYFQPEKISQKKRELPVEVIGFYMNNEEVSFGKSEIKNRTYKIPADIEFFKIEFAALVYHASSKFRYKYRIKELHSKNIELGYQNEINFHDLKPGNYSLEIFAADHHGNWNEKPFLINLQVDSYFYEKQIFKYGSVFLVAFLIFIIFNYRYVLIKQQKFEIERLVKERTMELSIVNDELKKANETKDKFFAIMSHDIKNPLASAQSVSEDLLENEEEYSKEDRGVLLSIINRSMQHLQVLLENLGNWSRLQNKEISPELTKCDIKKLVSQNANLANASLLKKRIKLFENLEENIFIYADCSMIDTILRNLISNAIKFSYFDSLIHVSAHKKGQMVEIQVEDKGVGMTEEQVNQLFIPGLSQSLAGTDDERGTGFGLLMVYEFVKLNKGMIDVISEPNHGSRFILSFPAYG